MAPYAGTIGTEIPNRESGLNGRGVVCKWLATNLMGGVSRSQDWDAFDANDVKSRFEPPWFHPSRPHLSLSPPPPPSRWRVCVHTDARSPPPLQCDEGDPCRNCIKRKESCVRVSPEPSGRRTSDPESPRLLTLSPPGMGWHSVAEPVNLLHMELLHHFERYSIPTLPFQGVWPRMLQLAFQVRTSARRPSGRGGEMQTTARRSERGLFWDGE